MLGDKIAPGIENQHAEVGVSVNLLCAVRTEHAGADHDHVKRDATVLIASSQVLQM